MTNEKELSGVLIIDKHAGVTSHDIVNKVRRAFGTRRVGHTGTLDPMATGVLVVLVGRAAKAAEFLSADRKHYLATLRLGITTDTEDTTGKILTQSSQLPAFNEVSEVCRSFVGRSMQTPPMYSAIKIDGKKLCDIARSGEVIEREARPIEIFSLDCTEAVNGDISLDVVCSAGTYIRTLCADIGKVLGCGGAMSSLRRLAAGSFRVEDGITVDELLSLDVGARAGRLMPIESLFADLPEVRLPSFYERLCRSGCEIYQKKIRTAIPVGEMVRICDELGHFFAIGRVAEFPDGSAVKAVKLFEL